MDMEKASRCFTVRTGEERLDLTARVVRAGKDWNITIYGGDRPHIGAVAIGQPRPSLHDPAVTSASSSVISVMGHKEDLPAKETAEHLAAALDCIVVVAAGMHWEHLHPRDLEIVRARFGLLEERIVRRIGEMDDRPSTGRPEQGGLSE
ncbi:MAG: hypothetical protein K9L28_06085 [Synergistales bacterium]|nr:hypothetical protein [Synergistales bacterium]